MNKPSSRNSRENKRTKRYFNSNRNKRKRDKRRFNRKVILKLRRNK